MAGIRVNTGVKRIEVNDAGEYIELNFGDQSLGTRFYSMWERINAKADEVQKQLEAAKNDNENIKSLLTVNEDFHRYMMAEIDGCFGADTCRKVFGNIIPAIDMVDDFFTQLLPYFEQGANERKAKMSKYTADRVGNA